MAVASGSIKSTLNPNAPLFVPAAFQQVEDFSPEWWELVKTTTWFRDYWFHEHQEQETFNGYYDEDDDIANLLPESFDLGIVDDFLDSHPHPDEEERFHQQSEADRRATAMSDDHKLLKSGLESEAERLIRNLSLKSPKNTSFGHTKQWERPAQAFSPRSGPRRIIQQPR